jgi:hypothetical protein
MMNSIPQTHRRLGLARGDQIQFAYPLINGLPLGPCCSCTVLVMLASILAFYRLNHETITGASRNLAEKYNKPSSQIAQNL